MAFPVLPGKASGVWFIASQCVQVKKAVEKYEPGLFPSENSAQEEERNEHSGEELFISSGIF